MLSLPGIQFHANENRENIFLAALLSRNFEFLRQLKRERGFATPPFSVNLSISLTPELPTDESKTIYDTKEMADQWVAYYNILLLLWPEAQKYGDFPYRFLPAQWYLKTEEPLTKLLIIFARFLINLPYSAHGGLRFPLPQFPMAEAVASRNVKAVEYMLKNPELDINKLFLNPLGVEIPSIRPFFGMIHTIPDPQITALHLAARGDSANDKNHKKLIKILKLICAHPQVDFNAKIESGKTVLQTAIDWENTQGLLVLLDQPRLTILDSDLKNLLSVPHPAVLGKTLHRCAPRITRALLTATLKERFEKHDLDKHYPYALILQDPLIDPRSIYFPLTPQNLMSSTLMPTVPFGIHLNCWLLQEYLFHGRQTLKLIKYRFTCPPRFRLVSRPMQQFLMRLKAAIIRLCIIL